MPLRFIGRANKRYIKRELKHALSSRFVRLEYAGERVLYRSLKYLDNDVKIHFNAGSLGKGDRGSGVTHLLEHVLGLNLMEYFPKNLVDATTNASYMGLYFRIPIADIEVRDTLLNNAQYLSKNIIPEKFDKKVVEREKRRILNEIPSLVDTLS